MTSQFFLFMITMMSVRVRVGYICNLSVKSISIVDIRNVLFDQEELNYGYLQYLSSLAIKCQKFKYTSTHKATLLDQTVMW